MKTDEFQGDLTDVSAKKEPLPVIQGYMPGQTLRAMNKQAIVLPIFRQHGVKVPATARFLKYIGIGRAYTRSNNFIRTFPKQINSGDVHMLTKRYCTR